MWAAIVLCFADSRPNLAEREDVSKALQAWELDKSSFPKEFELAATANGQALVNPAAHVKRERIFLVVDDA
jgi:hypothetical protein